MPSLIQSAVTAAGRLERRTLSFSRRRRLKETSLTEVARRERSLSAADVEICPDVSFDARATATSSSKRTHPTTRNFWILRVRPS